MLHNRREDILAKIQSRVEIIDLGFLLNDIPSPCHIWTGPTSGDGRGGGYGRMCLNGHTVAVHLVIFTNFYGYIPGNKQVDHLCNNRLCCNPDHLELITHLQNQRRRAKRAKENKPRCLLNLIASNGIMEPEFEKFQEALGMVG